MKQLIDIFGHGKDLNILQMGCRGMLIFLITLLLIRISGRRSFGIRSPLDNIIVILLGAMLSRAIAGVSPFFPVVATSFIIVVLHRVLGRILYNNKKLAAVIEGDKIILFQEGTFINENMKRTMLSKQDIMQGVRKSALTENLEKLEKIYIEANGEISAIKKNLHE